MAEKEKIKWHWLIIKLATWGLTITFWITGPRLLALIFTFFTVWDFKNLWRDWRAKRRGEW